MYEWGFDDKFAVVAFVTGHHTESYAASARCAVNAPATIMRENALKNLKVAQDIIEKAM